MANSSLSDVAEVIKRSKKIAVACHVRPDGDALGSALALSTALNNAGKTAYMLCDDEPPERLCIFPAMKRVNRTLPVKRGEIDLFVSVDCAESSRMGAFGREFDSFNGATLNIDHHVSNPGFGKYNYVLSDNTATCEILPEIFKASGLEINAEIADLLTLGLLTDSGNFSHKDVSAKTFAVASLLKEKGANFYEINYRMFTRQTKARALLYKRVLQTLRFELDDKLTFITVSQKDMAETGTDKSQTEGFVDYPLSIDGVEVSIALLEVKHNQYKASLRSKNVNVNAVAARFGGGGHALASGCMLSGEYEEVIERLTYAVYQSL